MSTETNYLDKPASYTAINCDSWCETMYVEGSSTPYTFVWIIRKFSYRKAWGYGNSPLVSTFFDIPIPNSANLTTSWRLQLERDGDFLSLHVNNCNEFEVKAEYKCSILDSNQERHNVIHSNGEEVFDSSSSSVRGSRKFLDIQSLRGGNLLPGDSLHIACDLTVIGAELTSGGKKTVNAKDTCSISSVGENHLCIDIPQKLIMMSKMIHGGEYMDSLTEAYEDASEELKSDYEDELCFSLNSDNCIKYLIVAEYLSLEKLKERSLEIAAENLSVLMKTSEWKEDLLIYPLLKDEIIESALALKELSVEDDGEEEKTNDVSSLNNNRSLVKF